MGYRTVIISVASLVALSASSVLPAAAQEHAPAKTPGWRVIKTFIRMGLGLEGGIVAFKDGSAWVAGESGSEAPVLYHLRHGAWSRVILLGPSGSFANDLSASSPTNVWAALANEPDVAHLDSSGWTLKSFTQGSLQVIVDSVQTFGPSNTWVFYTALGNSVHRGYAAHFTGSSWHATRLPGSVNANSLVGLTSASSPANIWALTTAAGLDEPMRYDGHSWQIMRLPRHIVPAGQSIFLRQILAQSPTNVWVTGLSASITKTGPILLLHWNGTKWSRESKGLPAGFLTGPICPDGQGGLWLAGKTPASKVDLLHFLNGKWTVSQAPPSPVQGKQFFIGFLARIPGTSSSVLGNATITDLESAPAGASIIKFGS